MTADSPIPLYHRVAAVLRQRVADGTYPVGSRLAAEDELAAEFDVSRATIRQAVGEVVGEGLLNRRQGRGTFVREHRRSVVAHTVRGELADVVAAGEVGEAVVKVLGLRRSAVFPPLVAGSLGVSAGTVLERTRAMYGSVFAYTLNFLADDLGRYLTRTALKRQGVLQLLEVNGVDLDRATHTIRTEPADPTVSQALSVALGAAVLTVERLTLSRDGSAVEVARSWYRSDSYEYVVQYTRHR